MRSLLSRSRHTDFYLLYPPPDNNLRSTLEVLRNRQRAGNIVRRAKRKYAQWQVTFRNMGDDAADKPVSACRDSHIDAALLPDCPLWWEVIQFGNRDAIDDLQARPFQQSQGRRELCGPARVRAMYDNCSLAILHTCIQP